MLDLVVIGAGLAGLSAALCAAQAGLGVRIVAKGLGSLHWTAGTLDLLGYAPGESAAVAAPFDAMARLPADHPYSILGVERVRAALAAFARVAGLDALGYVAAPDERNTLLPSPAGALRPAFLVPSGQAAGAADDARPVLVVGVEGLRDFYPWLIVENLGKQGHAARAATVPWNAVSDTQDRNPVQLATGLDEATQAEMLSAALKPLVRSGERIALPAILGMNRHCEVVAGLERATGARIFEIPTLPPSAPGVRFYQHLRTRLLALGGRIETNMEVVGYGGEGGRLEWVETSSSARPLRHHARTFLLATGGLLGGGFNGDHTGRVWETALDLPLTVPQQRSAWFRPQFFDPAGHPVFHGGVRVDARMQPLDESGAPVYSNLWAAGGALAGADPIRERSLEGIAIATGVAAAEELLTVIGDR